MNLLAYGFRKHTEMLDEHYKHCGKYYLNASLSKAVKQRVLSETLTSLHGNKPMDFDQAEYLNYFGTKLESLVPNECKRVKLYPKGITNANLKRGRVNIGSERTGLDC